MRRLIFDYLRYGYYRISVFTIPERKAGEGSRIDEKIIRDYGITHCRMTRMLRRRRGEASIVHLRFDRWVVLLATEGRHQQEGRVRWHDVRNEPFTVFGYSVSVAPEGTPLVKIAPRKWKRIREVAHGIALHNEAKISFFFQQWLEKAVPFNHPGVMRQKMKLRNEINHRRGAARLPKITRPRSSRQSPGGLTAAVW